MGSKGKSIQCVSDSYLCSNCGACRVVCPCNAIDFRKTSIGRMYASVNEDCIDCGLCQKVCPSLIESEEISDNNNLLGNIKSLRVGKALDEVIYKNSQSGGVCTALLKYLFDAKKIDGALLCKMSYGTPVPKVEAVIVRTVGELSQTQKSCYSPIELLGKLKNEIDNYKSLAIVGVGCHIEGVNGIEKLNRKFREKIFCKIGLICDRTLCGTIQDVYSSYAKGLGEIKINWKCKYFSKEKIHYRYQDAPLVIFDKQGEKRIYPNRYRFVLKDMFTSPRCKVCPDKLNLCSDVTLGDPWKMSDIDWENGESVVVGRTDNGESILTGALQAGYISLSPRPIKELNEGQLIEQRIKQTAIYSAAFQVLQPTIHSYLLKQSIESEYAKETEKARKELSEFRNREKLTDREIVKEARKRILKSNFEQTILFRILRKIYNLVRR